MSEKPGVVQVGQLPSVSPEKNETMPEAPASTATTTSIPSPPPKKPKLSKAERRALQEKQRAAKLASKAAGGGGGGTKTKPSPVVLQAILVDDQKPFPKQSSYNWDTHSLDTAAFTAVTTTTAVNHKKEVSATAAAATLVEKGTTHTISVPLVAHLEPYVDPTRVFDTGAVLRHVTSPTASSSLPGMLQLHPAVLALGYQYATRTLRGGNARCRAMLQCYSVVLADFVVTPPQSPPPQSLVSNQHHHKHTHTKKKRAVDLRYTVDHVILKPAFQFWTADCRQHSVSMGNAFSFLKTAVNSLDRDLSWDRMLETLLATIAAYVRERIEYAISAIAETACTKLLHDADEVLLTFGYSEAVLAVLEQAAVTGKKFRVVIVDSPPFHEGRRLLQKLLLRNDDDDDPSTTTTTTTATRIDCCYIHLHGLTYVLESVSKVLLGAAALQSDGSVTGRVGTAVVAMAAHNRNIPVLVCAETYKISSRVQLDSLTSNELGPTTTTTTTDPDETKDGTGLPKTLNLLYDLTPASYVSGIVTELGIIPPSSVSVLLREMNQTNLKL